LNLRYGRLVVVVLVVLMVLAAVEQVLLPELLLSHLAQHFMQLLVKGVALGLADLVVAAVAILAYLRRL
jgi:hypothetical protein